MNIITNTTHLEILECLHISINDIMDIAILTNNGTCFRGKAAAMFYKIFSGLANITNEFHKNYLLFFGVLNNIVLDCGIENNFQILRNMITLCCPNIGCAPQVHSTLLENLRNETELLNRYLSSLPIIRLGPNVENIFAPNILNIQNECRNFNSRVNNYVQAFINVFGNHPELFEEHECSG